MRSKRSRAPDLPDPPDPPANRPTSPGVYSLSACSIQYSTGGAGTATSVPGEARTGTDMRQSLVLNLESGKPLVISQGTDPIGDRRVTVEVTATILK